MSKVTIELVNGYFVEVDELNHTLKQRYIGEDKEGMCMDWCRNNDLLNPTYQSSLRDGCWYCHNQGLDQLRKLRKNYPQLWERLLYLDLYSPVSFKPDGVTLAYLDRRFALEDAQMTIFDFLK